MNLEAYVNQEKFKSIFNVPIYDHLTVSFLAQGEYNKNYVFIHPVTKQKFVLRINHGSQMHLKHQIQYEANALKLLEPSRHTPNVYYVDDANSILVMEFLPGEALDYKTQYLKPAKCLADIHSVPLNKNNALIKSINPLQEILDECRHMFHVYTSNSLSNPQIVCRVNELLDMGQKKVNAVHQDIPYRCCINTELNNTNFLVDNKDIYLVDWEKPLYGDPAQDLGHYLAPTTTFWKTDIFFTDEQIYTFIDTYIYEVDSRFDTTGIIERTLLFLSITCLRGITWCAMAWTEYQNPDRALKNASTQKKLNQYLEPDFLDTVKTYLNK